MSNGELVRAFMYPHRSQNEFLDLNKKALKKLGYDVRETNLDFVKFLISSPKKAIVILNWVEDRVYGRSYKRVVQYFLKMIALVIFSKIFAKKTVWVKHNFKPHNSAGSMKRFKFICGLYSFLKIRPVALEEYYSTPALIHPLYKNDKTILKNLGLNKKYDNDVIFFGGIKPYKNLDLVLQDWPLSLSLKIVGKCSDASYINKLNSIIIERRLNVTWDNRFVSRCELDDLLNVSKFVLLPHAEGTMISSGSFYHAIGEGCNILTNDSIFGREKSKRHSFVHVMDIKSLSNDILEGIFVSRDKVLEEVVSCYGEEKVVSAWELILASS
jgi:glycosyltransferase involved in cell wall biosynthesis